ncbi:MAG: type 1 glutamine amidotransferase [Nitrospiraceae bacterium]|nr:type 1 glutamine amidotransferase [Nitrospiraceae bacterium]
MKILILSADGFEDLELLAPYYRFEEEGFTVDIASKKRGKIKGNHDYEVAATKGFDEVNPEGYDMLFLPGGKAATRVRKEDAALQLARHFIEKGKPVAAICHGPQILISAGVVSGKRMTCWPEVSRELKEAGAVYEDKEVVVDGNLITSRKADDLPFFMREVMKKARVPV